MENINSNNQEKKVNVPLIAAIFLLGAFVSFFNETSLTTALPMIMKDLNVTASQGQWLTTIYMLVAGIMIPATPFLIKRFSTKGLFILSIGSFTIGTAIGAYAKNFDTLLAARTLQAFGAGMILPFMQTVFLTIFPKEKRGMSMGIMGIVIGVAPAIGPTLSGWLVEHYKWNDLFFISLPLVVIDLLAGIFLLQNIKSAEKAKLDILSAITSIIGFGGLLLGFSNAGTDGWGSEKTLVPIIVGVISLIIFVWRQLKMEDPFLDLRIFKNTVFTSSTLIIMVIFGGFMASEVLLPLYIQEARGYSSLDSGLTLLPGALCMLVVSPLSGAIFDKIGAKLLAIIGLILMTGGTLAFGFLTDTTPIGYVAGMYALRLIGLGLVMMPVTTTGLNEVDKRLFSHATAANGALRQIAGSISTALLVTVMSNGMKNYITNNAATEHGKNLMIKAQVHGLNLSFLIATGVTFIALLLAIFTIKGKKKTA
ncbi:MDR family MFS transporter [Clostridium mediterraneense]|uniref:MDR family MFS transporter n=1 Tax=Clostridium mediterraneense TaxID=1805472 RepID=UPI000A05F8D0|nr:MDR family MFS transporter [Clostridium mediterraneense]